MVTIRPDKRNTKLLNIKISGDDFQPALNILKYNLKVSWYDKISKSWFAPLYDYKTIKREFRISQLDVIIKNKKLIDKRFSNLIKWRKKRIRLRRLYDQIKPSKKYIKKVRKRFDVLNYKLYPFQTIGAYFLYNNESSLICDMVGLGKTIQALACSEKRMNDGDVNFNLIICPSTLKKNWEIEISKFTNKTCSIVSGHKTKRKNIYKRCYRYDYLVVNYDLLIHDIDLIEKYILDRDGLNINLIVDEIQYINNSTSQRSKLTKRIADKIIYKNGLSATLLENKVLDLFSSFHVIDKSVFGDYTNYHRFIKNYTKEDWFGNPKGYKNINDIRRRISPYIIRRLKEDVLDELPERIENNYWIKLSTAQRKIYEDTKNKIVDKIKDMEKAHKIKIANVLPMLIYLKQCVLSTKLVGYEKNISTKLDELINFFNSIDDSSKVVIFCHHPDMIELIHKELLKNKIPNIAMHANKKLANYCEIDDRVIEVKKWDSNKKYRALVASDILREGVNILSANYLVNFDLLFNPAKMEQRVGRIDRIGNKHKVINIINFIAEDTVEMNIFNKLYEKREMSTNIIDGGKIEKRLTIQNIKNIFGLT